MSSNGFLRAIRNSFISKLKNKVSYNQLRTNFFDENNTTFKIWVCIPNLDKQVETLVKKCLKKIRPSESIFITAKIYNTL